MPDASSRVGGPDSATSMEERGALRKKPLQVAKYEGPILAIKKPKEDLKMKELVEYATSLGCQITSFARMEQDFFQAISRRLVYQYVSISLEGYELSTLERLMAPSALLSSSLTGACWCYATAHATRQVLSSGMAQLGNLSAGISRGQMAPSESVIRVLATIMPGLTVTYSLPPTGRSKTIIEFTYCLCTGAGEVHPPKDEERREVELEPELEEEIRAAALADARTMADMGLEFSPEWWRQMGEHIRAEDTEMRLAALAAMPPPQGKTKKGKDKAKLKQLSAATFDVDSIRAERRVGGQVQYLVRWEGYQTSWEKYRAPDFQGQPGDPLETWEPAPNLKNAADASDLKIIRDMYGSRAQTIINALLSFDAYLNYYYPLKESIPFMCDMELREPRALENMRTAIDMQEIYERVSIYNHKSFMPHGAVYKGTADILNVADPWACGIASLELQNADTKRTASSSGARNLTMRSSGVARKAMTQKEGPAQLVATKGYSTTMAISTLKSLLVQQALRRGDGIASIPDSRRKLRLFQHGRTKLQSAGSSAADRAATYDPRSDSCVKAFVRLLADSLGS